MLKAGSLWVYPAKHAHYAWTGNEEAILEVQFTSPGGIDYINPADEIRSNASGACPGWRRRQSLGDYCSTCLPLQQRQVYGKTKKGEYMSEADAKAKGNHAERGKTCS